MGLVGWANQVFQAPLIEQYESVKVGGHCWVLPVQYNLNGSNTDGLFTLDDSNSFFSPYKIFPIAQENKYLGIFSYFIVELYVVCTH